MLRAAKARVYAMLFSVFLQMPKEQVALRKKAWKKLTKIRFDVLFDNSGRMRRKNRIAAVVSLCGMDITYFLGRRYGQRGTMQ